MGLYAQVLGLSIAAVLFATDAGAADSPAPAISVAGEGEVRRAPDRAVVSFAVETTASEASTAIAENARKSTALADALEKRLGKNDELSTTRYSLDPVYDRRRERPANQPPTITGYVARNQVQVETADLANLGELIDAATAAGANRVHGLSFHLADDKAARAEALAQATAAARHQAEAIAGALGVKLGKVLHASTNAPAPGPRHHGGAAFAMEARSATPVDPGDIRVHATVHATFSIAD